MFCRIFCLKLKRFATANGRLDSSAIDLRDRRVEITGPVERKMMINALNSGAKVFMADLEDALSPTWENIIEGQINLIDAVRKTLSFKNPDGKQYQLNEQIAIARGSSSWLASQRRSFSRSTAHHALHLFDFGLYFFHNAEELIKRGSRPTFIFQRWRAILKHACGMMFSNSRKAILKIPHGTIRATVLIETILAAFEMEEILSN